MQVQIMTGIKISKIQAWRGLRVWNRWLPINGYDVGVKKLSGISNKLSLDASGSNTSQRDVGMMDVRSNANPDHYRRQVITDSSMTEDEVPALAKTDIREHTVCLKNISGIGRKL